MDSNILTKWTTPANYFGFNPVGDYLLDSRCRDSSILVQHNFEAIRRLVGDECYTFTVVHFANEWIEYLMLPEDASSGAIQAAEECTMALDDYPILDEEAYSQASYEATLELWEQSPLSDRIQWAKEAGVSIFAARHAVPVRDIFEYIRIE